jgi:hypothetical protein
VIGLGDRALISVMTFAFARIGAAVAMRVEGYYPKGKRWWVRLHEKGGKRRFGASYGFRLIDSAGFGFSLGFAADR